MSGYPKYEIRIVIREDIRISEIRRISVIPYPYPISELQYPNSNPKSENYADIRKNLFNRIISLFGRSDGRIISVPFTPLLPASSSSDPTGTLDHVFRRVVDENRSGRGPALHLTPRKAPPLRVAPPFPGVQQRGRVRGPG
jgi:hypothetical protein